MSQLFCFCRNSCYIGHGCIGFFKQRRKFVKRGIQLGYIKTVNLTGGGVQQGCGPVADRLQISGGAYQQGVGIVTGAFQVAGQQFQIMNGFFLSHHLDR